MRFMGYLLSRTGLFPRFEPDVGDVRKAVNMLDDIEPIYKDGCFFRLYWWYITPKNRQNRKEVRKLRQLFRANGVLLAPHHSWRCGDWVQRALDVDQPFLSDVYEGYKDRSCLDKIEDRRKREIQKRSERFKKIFGRNR